MLRPSSEPTDTEGSIGEELWIASTIVYPGPIDTWIELLYNTIMQLKVVKHKGCNGRLCKVRHGAS